MNFSMLKAVEVKT